MGEHGNSGSGLGIETRHAHEAETYDAMASAMLADSTDEQLRVRGDRIPFHNREHVDYLSEAVNQLGPLAGKRILEVGAGSGSLAVWLALQGAEVTGIDVSAGILEVARKRAELSGVAGSTRFVHCPIEEFADDHRFDAVIGNNVVHHFERARAFGSLAELLRPGGRAVFCEPVLFLPDWVRRARYSAVVRRRFPPHTHSPDERSLDRDDLRLAEQSFGSVSWKPYQLLCRLQNFVELSDPTWNRLEAVDRAVLRRVAATRWLARMIVLTLAEPRSPAPSPKEENHR